MKVALVSGSLGDEKCGVGDYAFELAQFLALDAEVHAYFDRRHGPAHEPYERLSSLELRPVGGFSLLTLRSLVRSLREEGYDIIHLQYPSKGFGTSVGPGFLFEQLSGMQSRSRLVVTLHEWTTSHPLRKTVMQQILNSTDSVVTTNEAEMVTLVPKVSGKPVTVLPVGNILRSRSDMEAIWLEYEGQPVPYLPLPTGPDGRQPPSIFHYGFPARGKGLVLLLEALKLVREAGVDVELVLGGEFLPENSFAQQALGAITELGIVDIIRRVGHIPLANLEQEALKCMAAVFPFDEGFSSKRSSVATISHVELPIVVGAGSSEEHPYYAPDENSSESLAVLLVDLLRGRLRQEWTSQVTAQRDYSTRFSFAGIARGHLDLYRRLWKKE